MSRPAHASAFTPLAVGAMVFVGVVAFAAFFALQAFAPDLRAPPPGEHAASKAAIGHGAVVRLLELSGRPVVVSRRPELTSSRAAPSLVVLTPGLFPQGGLDDFDVAPMLVVLPKWTVAPAPRPGFVVRLGLADPAAAIDALGAEASGLRLRREAGFAPAALFAAGQPFDPAAGVEVSWDEATATAAVSIEPVAQASLAAGRIEALQTLSGANLDPVLVTRDGGVVLGRLVSHGHENDVYVLAEPDYLNTMGMADRARAETALVMLDRLSYGDGAILFDVTQHGLTRTPQLLKLALEPPFLWATLAALAALGFTGWHAAQRFGPPLQAERAIALGKQALADNTAALIRLAGREPRMGSGYAELTRAAVARALGARARPHETLDAVLDRIGAAQKAAGGIAALAAEAAAARDRAGVLAAAQRLFRWRQEMTRATD